MTQPFRLNLLASLKINGLKPTPCTSPVTMISSVLIIAILNNGIIEQLNGCDIR